MTAYLLTTIQVHDKAQFLVYAAAARGIAAKYGGRYLSTGRPLGQLEGAGIAIPVVLTEWPDADAIRRFWSSPEYVAAIPLREGAATVTATILDGNEDGAVRRSAERNV